MMPTKVLLKYAILSSCLVWVPNAAAGFFTYSNDWPDDADIVNEKISNPEVNSNGTTVKDTKQNKDSCNRNIQVWSDMGPDRISELNRLYAKFGATFFTAEVRKIQNTSIYPLSGAYVLENSVKDNYLSWEFALGTKRKLLRWELEYMYDKNINYDPSPVFANNPENLTSTIKSQSLWINGFWDIDRLNLPYFTPYLGAMVGFVWNKTTSTLVGGIGTGVEQSDSRMGIGWGLTIGARVAFWDRWFGYMGYKYMDQYTPRWKDSTGIMQLKGHYVVSGIDVGVQYLLG